MKSLFPDIASEWDYQRNETQPDMMSPHSGKKAWWICNKGHSYYSVISARTCGGQGCPYCAGKRVLKGFNDLLTTNPEIASTWDQEKNGKMPVDKVSKGSGRTYWWKCSKGHSYMRTVCYQVARNGKCPICRANRVVLCVETQEVFKTIDEVAKKIGRNPTSIRRCLSGKSDSCGGFHWKYVYKV